MEGQLPNNKETDAALKEFEAKKASAEQVPQNPVMVATPSDLPKMDGE